MRLVSIIILLLCTFELQAQNVGKSSSHQDRLLRGYVLCNGRKVEATYYRKHDNLVYLGWEDYSHTAIDTALAGRIEIPKEVVRADGQVFTVWGVSRHALADCRHITEVVLPDSLRDIGDQSFMNCSSLQQIVLPPGIRYLWPYAFRGCINLMRIDVRATAPPDSYNDVLDERTLRFATLVVPAASADAYRNAFVWNMFHYFSPNWDCR